MTTRLRVTPARAVCVSLLALGYVLVGCGGDPAVSENDRARAVADTLLGACAAEDAEAALGVLTPPAREELLDADSVLIGCARVLGLDLPPTSSLLAVQTLERSTVEAAAVEGGFGTATIRTPEDGASEVELESVGDEWLVSSSSATAP
jgi:hypothetical protein